MRLATLGRTGQRLTLRTARQSQALVIVAVDRLARNSETEHPRPLGRLWSLQLDLAGIVLGEPAHVVDSAYVQLQRLVALHREFAHRLLEAIDARELPPPNSAGANVIPLVSRLGS